MPSNEDWYKQRLSERPAWHVTFKVQCAATGTTHSLTAGNVTQTGIDSDLVGLAVDYDDALRGYVQAWTEWRDAVLEGDPSLPMPPVPTPPTLVLTPLTVYLPGVEPRTRSFANIIKADADYTQAIGEDYGIVAPVAGPPPDRPVDVRAEAMPNHEVRLGFQKLGYTGVWIETRRGGGDWEFLAVDLNSPYVDTRPPLVAGQVERREYRLRFLLGDEQVGLFSDTVSVSTVV